MLSTNTPTVSVCITAYNHESFIAQAIESVLAQKIDFDVEILVGEDDSDDKTRSIVQRFADSHPDLIRLFLNERRDASVIDGKATGHNNTDRLIRAAAGKYVALLDGDDFWSDTQKLSDQVTLLDSVPELSMCFSDATVVYEDDAQIDHPSWHPERKNEYETADLLSTSCVVKSTVMFRRSLIPGYPPWFFTIPVGDVPLIAHLSQLGNAGCIERSTTSYRVHSGGIWSGRSQPARLETSIVTRKRMIPHLLPESRIYCQQFIFNQLCELIKYYSAAKNNRLCKTTLARLFGTVAMHPKMAFHRSNLRKIGIAMRASFS